MTVGILALQGAFIEHEKILEKLGARCIELRKKSDLTENHLDALVFPGGESTVQGKLLRELDMFEPVKSLIEKGIPTLATCAGLILLAQEIAGGEKPHLACLPVKVKRNAYGRQLGSFVKKGKFEGLGDFEMTFIRAPYIEEVGEGVDILSTVDNHIVAARQGNQLATSFHPELGTDDEVHKYFLKMCE